MLLGAAKHLAETRAFDGAAVLIFQPAEEGGGGGREMVNDGVMERFGVVEVYGMHNFPGLPVGAFAMRSGATFAAADQFTVAIAGKGGHAARPHDCVDPTLVGAQMLTALQAVVARAVDPVEAAVLSVTAFHTEGDAFNVIPERATLKGTVRTLSPAVQDRVEARLAATVEHVARAFGAAATLDYVRNYPVTVNDPACTRFAGDVAAFVAGESAVDRDAPPVMGAEDFSFMLNARPGAYILLGNGDTAGVHHPAYDFNDDAIPFGASYWVTLVERALPLAPARG
jgi:hippurate hydrolase